MDGAEREERKSLFRAIQHGASNAEELVGDVNATDEDDCSLLHWCAINNRVRLASFLLARGATVNKKGGTLGETPLMWCCRYFYPRMLSLLLENGADVSMKSALGYDALHLACQAGNLNTLLILLTLGKANPNSLVDSDKNTNLLHLVKNRDRRQGDSTCLDVLRLLLHDDFHVDIFAQDSNGNTALHVLSGAPFKFNSERQPTLYASAPAVKERDVKMAWLLLEKGGRQLLDFKNASGLTAYQVSVEQKTVTMMRFLHDAWMFFVLPRAVPIVTTSSTVASLFLLLHVLGWLLGCLAFSLSLAIWDRTSQGGIRKYEGRLWFGLTLGLITSLYGTFLTFCRQYFSVTYTLALTLETFCILFFLVKTSVQDPASLPKTRATDKSFYRIIDQVIAEGPQEGIIGKAGDNDSEPLQICSTCLDDRKCASVHCSQCDRCRVMLDHHCPFVNNCVGKGNRRTFVLFCICAAVGCLWMVLSSLFVQYSYLCADVPQSNVLLRAVSVQSCVFIKNPPLAAGTLVGAFVALWTGTIAWQQVFFVAIETSTFELMGGRHDGKCKVSVMHALRNLWMFWLSGNYNVTPRGATKPESLKDSNIGGHHHHHHHHQEESEPFLASGSPAKKRSNSLQLHV